MPRTRSNLINSCRKFHKESKENKQLSKSDFFSKGLHGPDGMVVGFTTTYAISVYQH